MAEAVTSPAADVVKPYRIHIPTKHLDLTRQKLELTRLPHEPSNPGSSTWAPKPLIEPLIDYWLESYSWRSTEARLNSSPSLPQFRTALAPPGHTGAPVRVHFVHARSTRPDALPLLLVPPFPLANVALEKLVPLLTGEGSVSAGKASGGAAGAATQPGDGDGDGGGDGTGAKPETTTAPGKEEEKQQQQTFHVIIPSLPGIAFSDPLPSSLGDAADSNPVATTASLFDALMCRLGYATYLASATAPGWAGPERIDERVVRRLVSAHGPASTTTGSSEGSGGCIGAHLIAPLLKEPSWRDGVGAWGRWVVARLFKSGGWGGYQREDFEALALASSARREHANDNGNGGGGGETGRRDARGVGAVGRVTEPNTLAYALCDSPVGMLAFVLRGLRLVAGSGGSGKGKGGFSEDELITLTSLMWLPGPEAMLRFWAGCAGNTRDEEVMTKGAGPKPKVAITVFTGASTSEKGKQPATASVAVSDEKQPGLWPTQEEAAGRKESYYPPAWANGLLDVVHTQRLAGTSSGLLAFEQPEVILAGVRGLAKAVLAKNTRLAPLKEVVVVPAETSKKAAETTTQAPKSGTTTAVPAAASTAATAGGSASAGPGAAVPAGSSKMATHGDAELKGLERPSPPFKGPSGEGESPDTLVNTPPLERA